MKDTVEISGIKLTKIGKHIIVSVEFEGTWVEVIKEYEDCVFSHIVEPFSIRLNSKYPSQNKC